jgi:hypothetical protein
VTVHNAEGEGVDAPEADTEGSPGRDPRGAAGVHEERGMRGEQRRARGRPEQFRTRGTGGMREAKERRIMSSGRRDPDIAVGRT